MAIRSVIYALFLTITIAFIIGFRPIIINGGSMLPTLDYNDIIVIYKPAQSAFQVGDILTFQVGSSLVTHRIIEIDEDGYFYTQGDNPNNSPDGYAISYNKEGSKPFVVGKTYYKLKVTGQLVHWVLIIPNLISLITIIYLLFQANKNSKEFLEKHAKYL